MPLGALQSEVPDRWDELLQVGENTITVQQSLAASTYLVGSGFT